MTRFSKLLRTFIIAIEVCGIAALTALSHGGATAGATGSIAITGKVTNQTGAGVAGVSIYATAVNSSTTLDGPVTSATDGTYELDVQAGNYDFHYNPQSGSGLQSTVDGNVTVFNNQTINIQFSPSTYAFSGKLTDQTGAGVANVHIQLYAANGGNNGGSAVSDSNGDYNIAVAPDVYKLIMFYSSPIRAGWPNNLSVFTNDQFDLSSSNVTQNLNLNMVPLTVNVHTAGGANAANANLSYDSHSTTLGSPIVAGSTVGTRIGFSAVQTADSNGQAILMVPAGTVFDQSGGAKDNNNNIVASLSGGVSAYLASPVTVNTANSITITAPSSYDFSGVLKDQNGTGLSGVIVDLYAANNDGNESIVTTASDGSFRASVVPDTYKLLLRHGGAPLHANWPNNFTLSTNDQFNLTTADVTQNLVMNLVPLTVAVHNSDGSNASNATVSYDSSSGTNGSPIVVGSSNTTRISVSAVETTSTSGSVTLLVPKGTVFGQSSGATANSDNISASLASGSKLYLASPLTVTSAISITLQAPTNIFSGVLKDQNGTGLSGVIVDLYAANNDGNSGSVVTGSDGSFSVAATPDIYKLLLYHSGAPLHANWPNNFTLSTNDQFDLSGSNITQNLVMNLVPLTINERDQTGAGDSGATVSYDSESGTNGSPIVVGSSNATHIGFSAVQTTDASGSTTLLVPSGSVFGQTSGPTGNSDNIGVSKNGSQTTYLAAPLTVTATTTVLIQAQPNSPSNLTATSPAQYPVLSWSGVSGASSYNIYRNGSKIGSVIASTYTDSTAPEGTVSYFVTAISAGGESAHSNTVSSIVDRTVPSITYTLSPVANSSGWNNSSVLVTFTCADDRSGVNSCTSPVILNTEGANQTAIGNVTDKAGNTNSITTTTVNIDETSPTLSNPSFSINPIDTTQSTTLTVPVSDVLSGVVGGEYYLGNTDPGQGSATTMSYGNGTLSANFSGLAAGTYVISYRAVDVAGNWDLAQSVTLTVQPVAPSGLTAPSPTKNAPALSWTAVSGASSYNVYRDGSAVGSSTTVNYTDTAATEGSHSYYVTAVAGGIEGAQSNTVTVVYDTTPPTITYSVSPAPNSNGWNNADVTVTFTCNDTLSGVATCSSPVTVSTEGADQKVTGTATDNAGNTASVTTTPISIDKTAPTISYTVSPTPNAAGWNKANVTVTFTCSDALSGIQTCPAPVTVSAEGENQAVTGTAVDKAGNTASTTATINLDKTAPTIGYTLTPAANGSGWNNSNVTVTFNCSDALSGIASCSAPVTLSTEGANQTVTGTAVDVAGNTSSVTATVNIDKTAPTISYTVAPTANSNGWDNSNVTVSFTCSDTLSGIQTCPSPVTLSTDGANQSVSGTAVDKAGNTKSVTATGINIDKTAPTITYSVSPAPNSAGWNNSNVTAAFTCSDSLSGVQTCPSPVTLSTEGANQTVSGTVTDKAGNSTSVSTNAINIDKTGPAISAPTMSSTTIIPLLTGTVTFSATTSDSLSGVLTGEYYVDTDPGQGNGTPMTYSSGKINGSSTFSGLSTGQHTLFMRSKDKAGNWSAVVSVTFTFI